MKIIFGLGWSHDRQKSSSKSFKDAHSAALFEKYRERIHYDYSCEAIAFPAEKLTQQAGLIWICERSKKSRQLSSSEVAVQFQKACDSGAKSLTIWIGGPDGLSADQLATVQADLIWSFGSLTLPHELAAIVATEQIYRAISILKNHPYHAGH